jgi:hypothetical protein
MSKFAFRSDQPPQGSSEQSQSAMDAVHKTLTEEGWKHVKEGRYEHPDKPGHKVLVKSAGSEMVDWKHYEKPVGGYGWKDSGWVGPQFKPYAVRKGFDVKKPTFAKQGNYTEGLRRSVRGEKVEI